MVEGLLGLAHSQVQIAFVHSLGTRRDELAVKLARLAMSLWGDQAHIIHPAFLGVPPSFLEVSKQ